MLAATVSTIDFSTEWKRRLVRLVLGSLDASTFGKNLATTIINDTRWYLKVDIKRNKYRLFNTA